MRYVGHSCPTWTDKNIRPTAQLILRVHLDGVRYKRRQIPASRSETMWHPAARRVIPRRQFRFLICAGLTSALVLLVFLTSQSAPGQTPAPPTVKPTAGGLVKLIGDDE